MPRAGRPLLRLVHSLERRRAPQYQVALSLRRVATQNAPIVLGRVRFDSNGPRVFVVGTGERADLPTPPGLMPRHVAVLVVPQPEGFRIRAFTLHPDRGVTPFVAGMEQAEYFDEGNTQPAVGGVRGLDRLEVSFDGYVLEIETGEEESLGSLEAVETIPRGEQLAFFNASFLRPVGNVVSSVTGPGGGGHAIPALVTHGLAEGPQPGNLVLRSRDGVHRVEPVPHELVRGLLIGRSRRCILGRGFDENDGLSRIHALVLRIDDGVYAFDLASRYGLRDVARPNRLVHTARLDDGIGCLVYGAGHLLYES